MAKKEESKIIRRRLRNAYASSVISISLVLLLVGVATLLLVNARAVSDYFKENMQLSVILTPDASEQDAAAYQKSIQTLPYIKGTRLVSREEGTADLEKMLGADFLSVFETSPVPLSLEITLAADYVHPDSVAMVRRVLGASPAVQEVEWQQSLVETLNNNLAKISLILGIFILLLLFISFVLINNTVRLGVFSRRFTIHTMQLVGATRAFIRAPFVWQAALQGLVAALLAIGMLIGLLFALRSSFAQLFGIFTLEGLLTVMGIVLVTGIAICTLSTIVVVNRLVVMNRDQLYSY